MQTPEQKIDAIRKNAFACFNVFKDAELQKSAAEIFNNSYKIDFYTSLLNFFEDAEYFEDDVIAVLLESGDSVIEELYWQLLKMDNTTFGTYSEICDFIGEATKYMEGGEYAT